MKKQVDKPQGKSVYKKGFTQMEIIALILFIVVWLALQLWVLPKMGVST